MRSRARLMARARASSCASAGERTRPCTRAPGSTHVAAGKRAHLEPRIGHRTDAPLRDQLRERASVTCTRGRKAALQVHGIKLSTGCLGCTRSHAHTIASRCAPVRSRYELGRREAWRMRRERSGSCGGLLHCRGVCSAVRGFDMPPQRRFSAQEPAAFAALDLACASARSALSARVHAHSAWRHVTMMWRRAGVRGAGVHTHLAHLGAALRAQQTSSRAPPPPRRDARAQPRTAAPPRAASRRPARA